MSTKANSISTTAGNRPDARPTWVILPYDYGLADGLSQNETNSGYSPNSGQSNPRNPNCQQVIPGENVQSPPFIPGRSRRQQRYVPTQGQGSSPNYRASHILRMGSYPPYHSPLHSIFVKWGLKFDGTNQSMSVQEFIIRPEHFLTNFQQLLEKLALDWYWSIERPIISNHGTNYSTR